MKPKTIGYYKNVQNVGTCKATAELKLGMGVILDRAAKTASLPASDAEAKACHRIVTNINDKPEMHNYPETVVVAKGDYVRADDLTSVANMEMEFAHYRSRMATTTASPRATSWCLAPMALSPKPPTPLATRSISSLWRRPPTWARALCL